MNTIEELLARAGAIIVEKSRGDTSYSEKHGLVLYYYALFKIHGEAQYFEQMRVQLMELIAELLQQGNHTESVLSFPLISDLFEENLVNDALNEQIVLLDHYLFNRATLLLKNNNTDFIGGALGIIHYFARRLPSLRIEGYLRTLLASCYPVIETQYPLTGGHGTINLGIPGGLSGVLLVLMKCNERGLQEEKIKELIRTELLKIISYRLDVDFSEKRYAVFPGSVNMGVGNTVYSNTLCWSSGDLNMCMLFYKARRLFGDEDLNKIGDLVGLNTLLRKSKNTTNISNSHFSRGSAGLAQTYWFLFSMSGNHSYRAGYEFWISQTLELLGNDLASSYYKGKELDVLDGLVGVVLTLLSFHHPNNAKWSHCLLLD